MRDVAAFALVAVFGCVLAACGSVTGSTIAPARLKASTPARATGSTSAPMRSQK